MPSKRLEDRYARAEADLKTASATHDRTQKERSRAFLRQVLKRPIDERFEAIASTENILLPEDRLALLKSIRGSSVSKREITGGFASRFEIWRSRLRYKLLTLVLLGLVIVAVAIGASISALRTPKMLVALSGGREWDVLWENARGERVTKTIAPGNTHYQLMKINGNLAVLRSWEPGVGYTQFELPVDALVRVK